MAIRKRRQGCSPCVDAYLNLARKNGATDEEIVAALRNDEPQDT
ncbi:MAG: carboxymuconolactone decarboxylase family protein [Pseudonocardiaceae bacterium]